MQTIEEYEAKKTKDRLETKQRLKELSEMEIPAEQPKQQIVSIQTEPKAEPLSSAPVEVEPPATESHYSRNGIDVIGFAEMQFAPEELKGFYRINILKYVTRYDRKQDALGDLEKAASYLEKLIELEDSK